jgi:hypothetical protein
LIGLLLCLASSVSCFFGTRRSLGTGLCWLLGFGYLAGLARAQANDGFGHFIFDVGTIAVYVAHFLQRRTQREHAVSSGARKWVLALILWPTILALIPINHYLIQLVVLRHLALFIPMVVIGAHLTVFDLDKIAKCLVWLNLVAAAIAVGEMIFGIGPFLPENETTRLIYPSRDVRSSEGFLYRIPSSFISSHTYGGTMVLSLPFLLPLLFGARPFTRQWLFALAGIGAALFGILFCGARLPLILVGLTIFGILLWPRVAMHWRVAIVAMSGALTFILVEFVGAADRLQRFAELQSSEYVIRRVELSFATSLTDMLLEYPFGAGLGSAFGSSIPSFLAEHAPKQVFYTENEWIRIASEQGFIGLFMWLGFVGVIFLRPTIAPSRVWALPFVAMKVMVLLCFATATIGTGMLQAVPSATLLLLSVGLILARRPGRSASSVVLRDGSTPGRPASALARSPSGIVRRPSMPPRPQSRS